MSEEIQLCFNNLFRNYEALNKLSPNAISKDMKKYTEIFHKVEAAFTKLILKIWDNDTEYFKKNFRWPEKWSLRRLTSIANQLYLWRELYNINASKNSELVAIFSHVYLHDYYDKPKRKIQSSIKLMEPQNSPSLAKYLYAPLDYLCELSPFPTGFIAGIAVTLLKLRTNFPLFPIAYNNTKQLFSTFWQTKQIAPILSNVITKENFKNFINPMSINIGFLYLCGYFLHQLQPSDPVENYAASITTEIEILQRETNYNTQLNH